MALTLPIAAAAPTGGGTTASPATAFTSSLDAPAESAFFEDFSAPGTPSGNRNGHLSDSRFSVARWRQEMSPDGTQHVDEGPVPPDDVRVEAGRLVLDVGSQNYGDTLVRIGQGFDIAGRTGTVTFDTVLDRPDGALVGLWGWPEFMFLSEPYSAPSYAADNADGPTPSSGFALHFTWTCGAPILRTYRDGVETPDMSADHHGDCNGLPTTSPGTLNRIRLRISSTALEVCVSNAGQTTPQHCWSFGIDLDFTRGYLYFGAHNHASVKYDGGPVWTSVFDNISFDGPVLPLRVSQVDNGPGREIGHGLPEQDAESLTLTLREVDPTNTAVGRLVMSFIADELHNPNVSEWRLNFSFNDGPTHIVSIPLGPDGRPHRGCLFSIPIEIGELRAGTNTLTLSGSGFYAGYQPYVGNIDLVIVG